MSEEDNNDNAESTNGTTEEVVENTEESTQETSQEQPEFTEAERKLYARTKKAEAEAKLAKKELAELKKAPVSQTQEQKDMSSKDLYALMEHKVPSKHIDEVVKASKILGKSIQETLEDDFVQARLKTLSEEEQTANATNTGGSKRTTAKITDEQIVQRYMEGKDVDPEAFALARMNLRKKK